jgi:hypothetical protein
MNCHQCQNEAVTRVLWASPSGSHSSDLCPRCLGDWWRLYKHSPAGLKAKFLDLETEQEKMNPSGQPAKERDHEIRARRMHR